MLSRPKLQQLRAAAPTPNRIKAAMELAGLTQVQLADAIGSTQPHVADIANGNYSRLPLETARKFADAFGCSIEDLFPAREALSA